MLSIVIFRPVECCVQIEAEMLMGRSFDGLFDLIPNSKFAPVSFGYAAAADCVQEAGVLGHEASDTVVERDAGQSVLRRIDVRRELGPEIRGE